MKGNKLYTTKEMKAESFEPSVSDVKEATEIKTKPETHFIAEKRGKYYVYKIGGSERLGKFVTKSDAEDFINKQ